MNKKENNNLIILSTHTMCFCILGMMFLTIISSIGIFKSLINEYNQKMQYNEIFLILIAILVAPPVEEFIFRKLLFNFLRKRTKYYNLIQAILFGLAHGNPLQFIYTFLLGILLGNIKDRTGKVKISILMHMVFNITGIFFPMILKSLAENPSISENTKGMVVLASIIIPSIMFFITLKMLGKGMYKMVKEKYIPETAKK
jgi:abortive infection protein